MQLKLLYGSHTEFDMYTNIAQKQHFKVNRQVHGALGMDHLISRGG